LICVLGAVFIFRARNFWTLNFSDMWRAATALKPLLEPPRAVLM
jgi:hypothetical protein